MTDKPSGVKISGTTVLLGLVMAGSGCSLIASPSASLPASSDVVAEAEPEPVISVVGEQLPTGNLSGSSSGLSRPLGGRYGSTQYGSTSMKVVEVRRPSNQRLSVSVRFLNLDPANQSRIATDEFLLITANGNTVAAEVTAGRALIVLEPEQQLTRNLMFAVEESDEVADLSLEYANGTIPARFPLEGSAAPLPYPALVDMPVAEPIVVTDPQCQRSLTLTPIRAVVDVHLPVGELRPARLDARAPTGHRWLVAWFDVHQSRSDPDCRRPYLLASQFELLVDGEDTPIVPDMGGVMRSWEPPPRTVAVAWSVPTGTETAVLDGFDPPISFTLPEQAPLDSE